MEFGILGPLTVSVGGRALPVGGQRTRLVLARLLLGAGQPVSVEQLVDLAWDAPPVTARQQLHTVVHRLRRVLAAHDDRHEPASLRTVAVGYQLDLGGCRLDAEQFTVGLAAARRFVAEGALPDAVEAFRDALALWRGPALAGLSGAVVQRRTIGLEELRLAALEECAEVELRMGAYRSLIPRLQQLAAEHPARERFAALLMTALIQDGRRPDAIKVYHQAAQRLRDELGIDPGASLREVYLVAVGAHDQPSPATDPPLGHLPRAPRRLVGRTREVDEILAAIHAVPLDDCDARLPRVVVIDGMAGVGKSALALTVARALAESYADAHLFIDLRGHSEQQPIAVHEALGTLLRQLGVEPPDNEPDRIALWRRRLHGRRTILILDNVATAAQIEPLMQFDGAGVVLVTSRTQLAPIDGATSLSLGVLASADAVALLRDTSDHRVDEEPAVAAEIVALCGRLPLAIRLVGHRLRHRPRWSAAMMQTQLEAVRRAPIAISVGGHSTAAAFELSYRHLSEWQRLVFRRLGLHPAGTLEVWAAAALADLPESDTVELLDQLVEANLVQADIPGRYRMHDLVHAYAVTLVTDEERQPATVRMLDGYLRVMEAAGRHLDVQRSLTNPATPIAGPGPAFRSVADGAAWADTNWSTIVALVNIAEQAGAHRHTASLVHMASRSAQMSGRSTGAMRLVEQALAATEALGDDELTAATYQMAGAPYLRLGRHADCRASIERARHLYQRLGDEPMARRMRINMITILRHEGRHRDAVRITEEVLALTRVQDDRYGKVLVLAEGAAVLHELGRHEQARCMLVEAAAELRHHNTLQFSLVLGWLGSVHLALRQPTAAAIALTWAINLKRQHGNVGGAAEALSDYGRLAAANGHPDAALRYQQEAYEQVRALGDGYFEPIIGNHLGQTLTMLGRHDEAIAAHRCALHQAQQRQWAYEEARANAGIAAALRHTDPDQADAIRATAIGQFTTIGLDPDTAHAMCRAGW